MYNLWFIGYSLLRYYISVLVHLYGIWEQNALPTNSYFFVFRQIIFCHSKIHACALDRHNQITNIYKNLIIPNLFPPLVATNWLLARHWLQIGVKLSHSLRWDGKTERSWCEISTFPKHSHEQTSVRVKEGDLSALWRYWKSVYHESRLEVSVFYRMLLMLQQYETFKFAKIWLDLQKVLHLSRLCVR